MSLSFVRRVALLSALLAGLGLPAQTRAQPVEVTLRLDTNRLGICETTTLRVFAQIIPEFRFSSDRIFSWYLNVTNSAPRFALANYNGLSRPYSDNDPELSSAGVTVGNNRHGIHDSFLNLPRAGVTNPVELLAIPITGLTPGTTRFRVGPGSGSAIVEDDFIVVVQGGGTLLTGGDYRNAFVDLTVVTNAVTRERTLSLMHERLDATRQRVTAQFIVPTGCNCFVEFRNALLSGPPWQSVPGGPHNSGVARDTNNVSQRYYRLRANPAALPGS